MYFALIGAAGYVAPRHMKAIKETGNELIAILDKNDSVGVIDQYFPNADFFSESERFDRHLDKLRRKNKTKVDYVSICSPNFLHDAHIRLAVRNNAHAICEKPIVLNPWNIDALMELEKETGKSIFTILQLRHHPSVIKLKERISKKSTGKKYDIDLTYITSRGSWYFFSWKGDDSKSGGIGTNIGIHFFDMLSWIFGAVQTSKVHLSQKDKAAGLLELENARVRWLLSVDADDLPPQAKEKGMRTFRSITLENEEIEFSEGFTDLHTISYKEILNNKGYGLKDARNSVVIAYKIRNEKIFPLTNDYHPLLKNILTK